MGVSNLVFNRYWGNNFNTAIGVNALFWPEASDNNTAVGHEVMAFEPSGDNNPGVGVRALVGNVGSDNTAIGVFAMQGKDFRDQVLVFGSFNTATGVHALEGHGEGDNNTANEAFALQSATSRSRTATLELSMRAPTIPPPALTRFSTISMVGTTPLLATRPLMEGCRNLRGLQYG